jgi:signal transduction histidine kinase
MSIRLRLALWYGCLFALVLLLMTVLTYIFHVRGHYDDRDQALITSVSHLMVEAETMPEGPHLAEGRGGLEVGFRLYSPDGLLRERSPGVEALPPIDPQGVIAAPASSPFDALAQLAPLPPVDVPADGAFGLLTAAEQRWRVYVQPIQRDGALVGYLEALTPLGRLDSSIQSYRVLVLALGLIGLAAALLGGWAIASMALRPIARMATTAGGIAHSRDLSQRIAMPHHQDELGRLAGTFNEMLTSIEAAYRAQQRFVSDASHELRAPLTAIQGNLELLRRHPEMSSTDRDESLAEAEREAGRLTRLVADLLALARADAGIALQRRPVDLDMVVLDAFRTARPLASGQEVSLDPFEPAQVLGDEDRLKQLVLILLDNALKYTPVGGQVTLGLQQHNQQVEISVRDTGVGIAAEDLPHVFDRFYRADPARSRDPGGTGLGLAIASWIARQHAGEVMISSTPGQGTTVVIQLPTRGTQPVQIQQSMGTSFSEDTLAAAQSSRSHQP